MNFFEDTFGGRGGSQAQGTPTASGGASQGGTAQVIRDWLGSITGAYQAVTGAGQPSGPAPAVLPPRQPDNKKTWLIAGGVLLGVVALVFMLKK